MRTILNLSYREARRFFFKPRSYLSLDLPSYYNFERLLEFTRAQLSAQPVLQHYYQPFCHPRTNLQINYPLICNKDGQYAWRKHQIIHPFFYTSLTYLLTQRENWLYLTQRLKHFRHPQVRCASLMPAPTNKLNRNEQDIFNWSSNFTDETVRQALSYKYMLTTDLTHCYDSLSTPLLVRALHDENSSYDPSLLGWKISQALQDLSAGQTSGIPQGSALMDLLAETILGYIDSLVATRLDGLADFFILRYRDDYRIFANDVSTARQAMKILVETLAEFDLKINLSKTQLTPSIVQQAFKSDRLAWKQTERLIFCDDKPSTLKSLLLIHDFGRQYPNCGSIRGALSRLYLREIYEAGCHDDIWQISSVIADIMYQSPSAWPHCVAILSKYVAAQGLNYATKIADQIQHKFSDIPHTEHLDLWLQRLTVKADPFRTYRSPLCQIIYDPHVQLWNSAWLTGASSRIRDLDTVDYENLFTLPTAVPPDEVALFTNIHGSG